MFPGMQVVGIREELSGQQWSAVIRSLATSFPVKPILHITGGEPLLHADVMQVVRSAKACNMTVSLGTNGWLLSEFGQQLVELGLDRITVSVWGTEKAHDSIRGSGSYRRAIDGIRLLNRARREQGRKRPHIEINTLLSRDSFDSLEDMLDLVGAEGADHLTVQHAMFFDSDRSMVAGLCVEDVMHKTRELAAAGASIYPLIKSQHLATYYDGSSRDLPRGCSWNWIGLRIEPNGDVVPCLGRVFGNVADDGASLHEIWKSQQYRSFRRSLAKVGCFDACGRCCYRQY